MANNCRTGPVFDYLCTYRLAARVWPGLKNHQLPTVAARIGHQFDHHHAQADAEAAGFILPAMMKEAHVTGPRALAEMVGVRPAMFETHSCGAACRRGAALVLKAFQRL
jgi:DNA polymerase-3 subunit epsilon